MRKSTLAATVVVIAALVAYKPHSALAQTSSSPVYGSGASAVAVILSVLSQPAVGLPVAGSSGQGAPGYKKTNVVVTGSEIVALPTVVGATPLEVVINTPKASTTAEGNLLMAGGYESYGTTIVGGSTISLQTSVLGIPVTYLNINVANLTANVTAKVDANGVHENSSTDTVGSLTISGLLVGTPISISGPLKSGVIVNTPLVTITAHEVYGAVVGGQQAVILNSLDIAFGNSIIGGVALQGNIVVGSANAY